jgi:hypothetical protein
MLTLFYTCSDDTVSPPPEPEKPVCATYPATLDFDTVSIGSYLDKVFTIKNLDTDTLRGFVEESCAHYSIFAGAGAFALGAGDSMQVTVRYAPTSDVTQQCIVRTGSVPCGLVTCTGTGVGDPLDPGVPDTLLVESLDVPLGTTEFDLNVYMSNDEELMILSVPLEWNSADLTCDTVLFDGSRIDYLTVKPFDIDNPSRKVLVLAQVLLEQNIQPGSGLLFTLRFSVDPSAQQQVVVVDTTFVPPSAELLFATPGGSGFAPRFVPGQVRLD